MKRIAVFYRSNYGHAERYARWIAEALNADLLDGGGVKPEKLRDYDGLIFGSGIYAGDLSIAPLLVKNLALLQGKQLAVFTVGLTDPADRDYQQKIVERNFPIEAREGVAFHHFRGGIDYKRMGLFHRAVMFMMRSSLSRKPEGRRTEEDKVILKCYGSEWDGADPAAIRPLVESFIQPGASRTNREEV